MSRTRVEESGGNVFMDLGLPDAGDLLAKAGLAHRIELILDHRKLTQKQAAEILRVDQPKISALRNGELRQFSIERLLKFLMLLGCEVKITIKQPRSGAKAKVLIG